MFVIADKTTKVPVKVWLPEISYLEESCIEQATNLSKLPFLHQWVCLMPDTHTGKGMPIGGVIATKEILIPNAVGVDIGCGMVFTGTNLHISEIADIQTGSGSLIQAIIGDILRNVPVGFAHHTRKQPCATLDKAYDQMELYQDSPELVAQLGEGYFQIGTLGGGNHFIELQADDEGFLGIMIHSGSRHFGLEVCNYFHKKAVALNKEWYSEVPEGYGLAFLPVKSKEGMAYRNWMNLAMDFARENRTRMMADVRQIVDRWVLKYLDKSIAYSSEINCHHNYAAIEHHYGKNVWVHRKGATRARTGDLAVIPGAMGSYSYVVEGLGNEMSFCSSSHGAGRQYSRKGAIAAFSVEKVMTDLKEQGVVLGKHKKDDVAEESRFAYKDIDMVMENQKDLVRPVKRLKTIGVVKG